MRFIYSKAFGLFSLGLAVVALVLFLQAKGYLDPIRAAFVQTPRPVIYVLEHVTRPTKSFFYTLYHLKGIVSENADLHVRVAQLQQETVRVNELSLENDLLKKELGFAGQTAMRLVPCTVVAHNPSGIIDNTMVLNCGSNLGVSEGQAVISQGYLVGKVIVANKYSSTVLLSTSSKFSTDAKLSNVGAVAVVRGSFGSGEILDQLPQDTEIQKGWQVATAGISQQIPKGILIGEVGEVLSGQNDLLKRATVVNPVNFDTLEYVWVAVQ